MKEQEFDPRDFYDYEKEESGKTDAEIDAIVGEIYRSVVGGTLPVQTAAGSRDRTRQAACAMAPDAEKLNVEYQPGTISLDVQDGKVTALRVELGGSVQVAAVDTQASLAAQFTFRSDLTAEDVRVPAAALEKL